MGLKSGLRGSARFCCGTAKAEVDRTTDRARATDRDLVRMVVLLDGARLSLIVQPWAAKPGRWWVLLRAYRAAGERTDALHRPAGYRAGSRAHGGRERASRVRWQRSREERRGRPRRARSSLTV